MAQKLDSVKIVMLKGEKGDTGLPSDNQVQAQIAKFIKENPETTIDETIIDKSTKEWLNEKPVPLTLTSEDATFQLPVHTINDSVTANDSTWSSQKTDKMINQRINDSETSTSSTWSSDKINKMIARGKIERININKNMVAEVSIDYGRSFNNQPLLFLQPHVGSYSKDLTATAYAVYTGRAVAYVFNNSGVDLTNITLYWMALEI